ncbi:zinc finger protein CONSTANS-LIKE 6-like [Pyrus ussuriensis x Pyrus communis]|uniref:Zinc finger protein CONSTANS-LIKE 6-like n=1 Tax=Pyrus ussuriensis x Pyrus communis TaxID=2448454 RepID=A0A5N5GXJ0_9ROSA|nr:zinc finger protein CONSTANS-LIKE 6-like [Pyrus ussuriensis x Pyrus communis]
MCNKKSLPAPGHDDHVRRSSMIDDMINKEEEEEDELIKHLAARKSRTKTRKPKFLSLRSQLISEDDGQSYRVPNKITSTTAKARRRPQLNLFPLHPETRVNNDFEDKGYMQQDENVALLFESDGGATLNGLLTSTTTTATATASTSTMSSDLEEAESFPYYKGREEYREETVCDIVRTAMRSKERETSVEKWVFFSELVEGKKEEDCLTSPTTSTTGTRGGDYGWNVGHQRRSSGGKGLSLALKLDYEEILNAWSDKGPLYIDGGDSPQTVPDLLHQQDHQLFHLHENSSTPNGSGGNLWRVPEEDGSLKMKMEQRETSMLRYKEKRRNRLYSKRIRYQVRKLNAEKRPRMKGRFVKRS